MKLLFVAVRFHTNQVPLVRALSAAGHEVRFEVLCEGKSEDHSVVRPNLMPIAALPRLLLRRRAPANPVAYHADHTYPSVGWYLRRLRALAPDVVVIRDPSRPYAWRAAVAARLLGRRIVFYTQGDVHGRPKRFRKWMRAAWIAAFDAVWFSPVPGDPALPKVHPDMHYVPFAADLSRPTKASWFADDRVHLLSIGKFVLRKNHALLLEAFDELRRTYDVHLTLVGEVSTDEHRAHHAEIVELIRRRSLGDHVAVRTNVPFGELRRLYLEHDVFVLPSRLEPASVSVLEAMSHGLPVVCSTSSGTRWYLEAGRNGRVFASDDLGDLVRKLDAVVADRPSIVRMGNASRELAESVHHPDRVVEGLMAMIRRWRGAA